MSESLFADLSNTELAEQGQNSLFLKEQAIELIQQLSSQQWTDHNTADPGVTLLEVLSFAISDLSYRLSFSVPELLSPDRQADQWEPNAFYLAPDILPSNMVTNQDIRQAIIDITGIKNVAVLPGQQTPSDGSDPFSVGAVELLLELQAEWAQKTREQLTPLLTQVRERFLSLRNVNQDLLGVQILKPYPMAARLALELNDIASPIDKIVEILQACQQVIAPKIDQYSLNELQEQGLSGDEIFVGPLPNNNFIAEQDLNHRVLPEWIFASDVLEAIRSIEGLQSVDGFCFINEEALNTGEHSDEQDYWRMAIPQRSVPLFSIDLALDALALKLDGQAFVLDNETRQKIHSLLADDNTAENSTANNEYSHLSQYIGDRYRQLNHYVSIQQDFPELYKLNEERIDTATDLADYAQILQLKGFLSLFDQILADEVAQLDNLRKLLAIPDHTVYPRLLNVFNTMLASETLSAKQIQQFLQDIRQIPHSQLSQPITGDQQYKVSGVKHLLKNYFDTYQREGFQTYAEPVLSQTQLTRLTHALDHLLSRFAERRLDASLLKYRPVFANYLDDFQNIPDDISSDAPLVDKLVLLKSLLDLTVLLNEYPLLSQQRAGGINYLSLAQSRFKPAGLLRRIARFLGLSHLGEMPLAVNNRESLYLLESELLRHGADAEAYHANELYFVMPDWPTRFHNPAFRTLLADQLRQQSLVHQQVFLIPLSRPLMSLFERLYFAWLNAMTQKSLPVNNTYAIPHSAHNDEFIARLSTYLREFVKRPEHLLELILSTLQDPQQTNNWQPLLQAIAQWLEIESPAPIVGENYHDIYIALNNFLQQQSRYGAIDADTVLFAIAHQHLSTTFSPYPISNATIGKNFRIAYQPLYYLQTSYPIAAATIHSGSDSKPNFTISTQAPRSI